MTNSLIVCHEERAGQAKRVSIPERTGHYYMDINDHFNSKMGSRELLQTTDNITCGQPVALVCGASEAVRMREGILGWFSRSSRRVRIAAG